MKDEGAAGHRLVCLYCGAEAASAPPYEVRYCNCRSRDEAVDSLPMSAVGGALLPRLAA